MPGPGFIAVATLDAVRPGTFVKVVHAGRSYLIANVEGRFYAVEDNCSHEDYPLSYGCLDGARIKCSLHGSRFDLATGNPAEEPAELPIRTYRVVVEEGRVWLDPAGELD